MKKKFAGLSYWRQQLLIAKNLIYAVLASALMNFVLQFFLYPVIERQAGETRYGEILVMMTIANVCGLAFGSAGCSVYLTSRQRYKSSMGDYFCILAAICVVSSAASVALVRNYLAGPAEALFLAMLITLTVYQNYSFLEFQLRKNYAGYLLFVAITSGVQIACIGLFRLTDQWAVLLLPGMAVGLLYVWRRGRIYRRVTERSENFGRAAKETLSLSGANMLNYGAQNADRFLLLPLMGGTAVTYYYVASLLSKTLSMITGPINNLIVGYLSDKEDPLDRKTYLIISTLILAGCGVFLAAVTVLGPWLLKLPFLYPDLADTVRPYIFLSSVAQMLVIGSSILVTIDLVVAPNRMQMVVQSIYAAVFAAFTVPATIRGGLSGFVAASCAAAAVRWLVSFAIGWKYIGNSAEGSVR